MIAMMFALTMSKSSNTCFTGGRRRPAEIKHRDNTMVRKLYKVDYHEHEFIIHGEAIMARNRKTALKIYANRHKSKA